MELKIEEDITQKIIEGVRSVYSSDKYKKYLDFISRFHNYSFNNQILIFSQCEGATYVAGYKTWEKLKRNVKKGEKAIKILAPYTRRFKNRVYLKDENNQYVYDDNGNRIVEENEFKLIKYRWVNVFDVSQTEGEGLPQIVEELKGTSSTIENLVYAITAISEASIVYRTKELDPILKDGAKGYYERKNNSIVIDADLEDFQKAKTLVHEYAHSILHKDGNKSKDEKEIEAESIAYIVCKSVGLDTSSYSFPYIFTYCKNNDQILANTLDNIRMNTLQIIGKIKRVYEDG